MKRKVLIYNMRKKSKVFLGKSNALKNYCKDKQGVLKAIRSCESCIHYYSDVNCDNEYCHNTLVTSFDYIEDGSKTYCCYWIPPWVQLDNN